MYCLGTFSVSTGLNNLRDQPLTPVIQPVDQRSVQSLRELRQQYDETLSQLTALRDTNARLTRVEEDNQK